MWRLSTASGWLTRLALVLLITLRLFRLDQQQAVIELNVGIPELKSLEIITALAISRAKKIAALRASMNRVHKHVAVFQARQGSTSSAVFSSFSACFFCNRS